MVYIHYLGRLRPKIGKQLEIISTLPTDHINHLQRQKKEREGEGEEKTKMKEEEQ